MSPTLVFCFYVSMKHFRVSNWQTRINRDQAVEVCSIVRCLDTAWLDKKACWPIVNSLRDYLAWTKCIWGLASFEKFFFWWQHSFLFLRSAATWNLIWGAMCMFSTNRKYYEHTCIFMFHHSCGILCFFDITEYVSFLCMILFKMSIWRAHGEIGKI